jgi:Leucine-rich repeat (LRR) protein
MSNPLGQFLWDQSQNNNNNDDDDDIKPNTLMGQPAEMLSLIFSKTTPADQRVLRLVSKTFKAVIDSTPRFPRERVAISTVAKLRSFKNTLEGASAAYARRFIVELVFMEADDDVMDEMTKLWLELYERTPRDEESLSVELAIKAGYFNDQNIYKLLTLPGLVEFFITSSTIVVPNANEMLAFEGGHLVKLSIIISQVPVEFLKRLVLKNKETLQDLNFYSEHLDARAIISLSEAFKECTKLLRVELGDNAIGDEGASALGKALQNCRNLNSLGLFFNNIGDAGIKDLAAELEQIQALRSLDISGNEIKADGAKSIAKLTMLTRLFLDDNEIGDDGATALAAAFSRSETLEILSLRSNLISDSSITAIEKLAQCQSLRILSLRENGFTDAAETTLKTTFREKVVL